jgi:hypothetical protein
VTIFPAGKILSVSISYIEIRILFFEDQRDPFYRERLLSDVVSSRFVPYKTEDSSDFLINEGSNSGRLVDSR